MNRPPLEVADLIRSAGTVFLERNRQWLRWNTSKCCWPLRAVVLPHSAGTAIELNPQILNHPTRHKRFSTLESEAHPASPCALRHSRRWVESRSHPLGAMPKPVLSSSQGALESLSRQVRRWSQAGAPKWSTGPPGKPRSTRPAEAFRCVAAIAVPQGLGGLRQTPLRRSRIRAAISGPIHSSRGHLQPSPGLVY